MPEKDFETSFANLAYSELEQKIPTLMPFNVGFQLVDKNDNDTRAVGIFGFNIGEQWYYVPVFWLNGRIKGFQLLYIVSQDMFVPLSEEWVNFLKNKQPTEMGEKYVENINDLGYIAPDFTLYRRSPLTKAGSWEEALKDLPPEETSKKAMRWPSDSRVITAEEVIKKASVGLLGKMLKEMNNDHVYAEAVLAGVDPEHIKQAVAEKTKAGDDPETTNENLRQGTPAEEAKADGGNDITFAEEVKVVYSDGYEQGIRGFTNITNEEKEREMAGKVVVRDKREDADVAKVFAKPDFTKIYQTVGSQSGLFRVINEDGESMPALVGDVIVIGAAKYPRLQVVVDMVNKKFLTTEPGDLYSSSELEPSLWQKAYDEDMIPMAEAKKGDFGVMVDKSSRRISIPFEVNRNIINDETGTTSLEVAVYDNFEKSEFSKIQREDSQYGLEHVHKSVPDWIDYDYRQHTHPPTIKVVKGEAKVSAVNNATIVGEGAKFFKLGDLKAARAKINKNRDYPVSDGETSLDCDLMKEFTFNPGGHKLVDLAIQKMGMASLNIKYDGNSEVSIYYQNDRQKLTKKAAIKYLVGRVNMREDAAEALLKQAVQFKRTECIVKSAEILPGFTPSTAYSDVYGAPVQYSWSDSQVIPSNFYQAPTEYKRETDNPHQKGDFGMDQGSKETLLAAAQKGNKEVFDISLLMNLVRSAGLDDLIRSYAKDIIVGNDRIGRLLFAFYWHFDEISDKYGEDSMTEFEGLLNDVFESTGELVLFLSKKSVEVNEATLNPVFG